MSGRWWRWRQRRTLRRAYLACKREEAKYVRWTCPNLAAEVRQGAERLLSDLRALDEPTSPAASPRAAEEAGGGV